VKKTRYQSTIFSIPRLPHFDVRKRTSSSRTRPFETHVGHASSRRKRRHHVAHFRHPPHAQVHDEPSPCPSPVRECSIPARLRPDGGCFSCRRRRRRRPRRPRVDGAHALDSDANSSTRFSLPSSQILDVLHPGRANVPKVRPRDSANLLGFYASDAKGVLLSQGAR